MEVQAAPGSPSGRRSRSGLRRTTSRSSSSSPTGKRWPMSERASSRSSRQAAASSTFMTSGSERPRSPRLFATSSTGSRSPAPLRGGSPRPPARSSEPTASSASGRGAAAAGGSTCARSWRTSASIRSLPKERTPSSGSSAESTHRSEPGARMISSRRCRSSPAPPSSPRGSCVPGFASRTTEDLVVEFHGRGGVDPTATPMTFQPPARPCGSGGTERTCRMTTTSATRRRGRSSRARERGEHDVRLLDPRRSGPAQLGHQAIVLASNGRSTR